MGFKTCALPIWGFAIVTPDGPAVVEADTEILLRLHVNQAEGFAASDCLAIHRESHGAAASQAGFQTKTARWGLSGHDRNWAAMLADRKDRLAVEQMQGEAG